VLRLLEVCRSGALRRRVVTSTSSATVVFDARSYRRRGLSPQWTCLPLSEAEQQCATPVASLVGADKLTRAVAFPLTGLANGVSYGPSSACEHHIVEPLSVHPTCPILASSWRLRCAWSRTLWPLTGWGTG
jgi:hypothetical protein